MTQAGGSRGTAEQGAGTQELQRGWVVLAQAVLLAFVYYLAAALSRHLAIPPNVISPLWPPTAIALCACLLWGQRMAPAILLSATFANWMAGLPELTALALASGSTLEAVVGAFLINRLAGARNRSGSGANIDFTDPVCIFKFVRIALVASLLAATIGVAALALSGVIGRDNIVLDWLTWWLGNAASMVVLTPMILAWRPGADDLQAKASKAELMLFLLLVSAVSYAVFSDLFERRPLIFLPIPFIIWAAFRLRLRLVVLTTALICAIAVWNVAQGQGPLVNMGLNASLLLAVTYTSVVGTMGLLLAGLVSRYRTNEAKLREERDQLELRVQNRTSALIADVEKRRHIETELAVRERQLAEAQHLAQLGSWNWDLRSNRISWSDELYRISGKSKADFVPTEQSFLSLIHPDDFDLLDKRLAAARATGKPFYVEHRIVPHPGETRIVAGRVFAEKDAHGNAVRMYGTIQDITESKQAELALCEAEERSRLLVELCPDGIAVQQDGRIIFVNRATLTLLGARTEEELLGRLAIDFVHPDSHHVYAERMEHFARGEALPFSEEKLLRLDGSAVDVEVHASSLTYKGAPAILMIARDITERKKSAEQLAWLAHYDSLTNLPNRSLFHQRLAHAIDLAQRSGKSLEILFLDLDRFKVINDTLGHAVGDLVLQEAAVRLQSILRESDTVARLGGDEFVVLVEAVDKAEPGRIIAEKILAALAPPFMTDREPLHISASIGISTYPADGVDAVTLLKKADIAMYRAKEAGRNAYRYYSEEMNTHSSEQLALQVALSHALGAQQLSLHYQPKIDLHSNRITGMEALLRWQHPTLGWISPEKFIPLAEETGLINPIGRWALRSACEQNKRWQETSKERLRVAVNLSPRQLSDPALISDIQEVLRETGLDAACLELEITENSVMDNPVKAIDVLSTLRSMGVSVTIDDFGVGYSSLAYLQRFPIHSVKIDRSFVDGVPDNPGDAAITKAIITLAHSLECEVIAEGAETQTQIDFLRAHDCDSVQGYFFSRPISASRFGRLLNTHSEAETPTWLH